MLLTINFEQFSYRRTTYPQNFLTLPGFSSKSNKASGLIG